MNNRRIRYIIGLIVACIIVTASVLMPGVLLDMAEESTLGNLHIVSNGNFISAQSEPSAQHVESISQLTEKVHLFNSNIMKSTLSKEYSDGGMGMSDAVDSCVKQVTSFMNKNTIPVLNDFPQSFTVKAELRTISDDRGELTLQYWNIDFIQTINKTDASLKGQEVSISLDAQTGIILAMEMKITTSDISNIVDIVKVSEAITKELNIPGKLLSLNQESIPQTVMWKFDNSSLIMLLTIAQYPSLTSLTMALHIENDSTLGVAAPAG